MPFSKSSKRHSQKYWTNHFQNFLKPEIEKLGNIEVSRSDELRGDIVKDIIISLYESDIVIADITDNNPNVFWELGVRLSLQYKTITIAEDGTQIPFDVSTKKVLFYLPNKKPNINEQFFTDLKNAIHDCIDNPDKSDSIVIDVLSLHKSTPIEEPDSEFEIQQAISDFNGLIKRLYKSKGVINKAFATELLNNQNFKKYLGISPGDRYGKSLGDHEIYILDGKYYIIPNSITLRKLGTDRNYTELLYMHSEESTFQSVLDSLNDDIIEYIKEQKGAQ
jgi:hypothetical protein